MGKATFKMVAAGDGSPQSASGYSFLVLAHATATVLLLITLVAAVWQFMDWVVTPSCPGDTALSSVSSSAPLPAPAPWHPGRCTQANPAAPPAGLGCPQRRPLRHTNIQPRL
ncbi:MAG TPA: hypothetical protein VGF65_14705, partial [Mycobacterium sp.]